MLRNPTDFDKRRAAGCAIYRFALLTPDMPIHDALKRLIIEFDESERPDRQVRARGQMSFGAALEGPPGRLHGGHHAFVRTLPIAERLTAHEDARTFPCSVDVTMKQSLPLERAIEFEASYRSDGASWWLDTRFEGTDRLVAHAHSIPNQPLVDHAEMAGWRSLYEDSVPGDDSFEMFGFTMHLAEKLAWIECRDPSRTRPDSQHAALVEPGDTLGPAFVATQLDAVGATSRGALMRHPQFTTHIEIQFAMRSFPAETHLLCLADRTRMEDDPSSEIAPVEINGVLYRTVTTPVALVDAAFERAFATGRVTVHPVDPAKFAALRKMRQIRND